MGIPEGHYVGMQTETEKENSHNFFFPDGKQHRLFGSRGSSGFSKWRKQSTDDASLASVGTTAVISSRIAKSHIMASKAHQSGQEDSNGSNGYVRM